MHSVDYNEAPFLVIWEVTRACSLVCRHCRASAEDLRSPLELSLSEGKNLIDQVADLGTPLLVFTGGDPLQRDDLEDLVRHARRRDLTVATIPAATPRLTRERVHSLADAGIQQLALSLDGATREKHDAFRQVDGTFDQVLNGAKWIREAGVPLQINTVFGSWNVEDFDALAQQVQSLGAVFWEVFFLVPVGRGQELQSCTADEFETLFAKVRDWQSRGDFHIKVTEGQHYRRYLAQNPLPSVPTSGRRAMAASKPVNAGNGFLFVDYQGNLQPSGFLPITCGNFRKDLLSDVYQKHPTFRQLRDFSQLVGKCKNCQYIELCSGGSRARAFGVTGDYRASEPFCAFQE